ncbi:MAG: sigma-70 family RNA polymerase sigma factor [Planctomycetaceae bacterium]|nr:sigma-70 family RNA polymerase sigma factor [Planctomycetaceae bacterium]
MSNSIPQREATLEQVEAVRVGDGKVLAQVFDLYRDRLWQIVNFRLDHRLRGRVDADDILQEAYLDAEKRIQHFSEDTAQGLFIWLRLITNQTLIDVHRRHLGTRARDASRDRSISRGWSSESTSFSLSSHLLGHLTSPSQAALRAELSQQLIVALDSMGEMDREVLALRHFEELTNSETAKVLSLSEQAASLRYVRALGRLKQVLQRIPGFSDQFPA